MFELTRQLERQDVTGYMVQQATTHAPARACRVIIAGLQGTFYRDQVPLTDLNNKRRSS